MGNISNAYSKPGPGGGHAPTERTRGIVESAVSFGIPYADIAKHLGIGMSTLMQFYDREISEGLFNAHMKVGGVIFNLATQSADENVRLKAACYYAARRMGWVEPSTDNGKQPSELVITVNGGLPMKQLGPMTKALLAPDSAPENIEAE